MSQFETYKNSENAKEVHVTAGSLVVFKVGDMYVLILLDIVNFKQEKSVWKTCIGVLHSLYK